MKNLFEKLIFKTYIWLKLKTLNIIKFIIFRHNNGSPGFKNIIVIKSGGLGDFTFGLPAMTLIREYYPQAKVTLVTSVAFTSNINLFKSYETTDIGSELPWTHFAQNSIDEVIVINCISLKTIKKIRELTYFPNLSGIFILTYPGTTFMSLFKTLLFVRIILRGPVICYGVSKDLDYQFLRLQQSKWKLVRHKMLGCIDSVLESRKNKTFDHFNINFNMHLDNSVSNLVEDMLGSIKISSALVVAPVASHDHKQWPIDNFIELFKIIEVNDRKQALIFVGTKEHYKIVESIRRNIGLYSVNLCGIELRSVALILSKVKVFIGNDGGMSQLAGALRCKSIVIANSIEEANMTYPWFSAEGIVRNVTPCSPCYDEFSCPLGHNKCVKDISVEQVWAMLLKQLVDFEFRNVGVISQG